MSGLAWESVASEAENFWTNQVGINTNKDNYLHEIPKMSRDVGNPPMRLDRSGRLGGSGRLVRSVRLGRCGRLGRSAGTGLWPHPNRV
jgi:hypothetical protein